MKKQLRNIAFAAAALVCGSAMAQDVVTLTPAWTQVVPCSGAANVRFGMGHGGKVYFQDKGAHSIVVADGTNYETYIQDDRLTGTGVTIDKVGNIVANTDFPNNTSSTNYLLIDTDKNVTEINLTSDDIEEPGRVDFMGRSIGNFMSEEGGVFYIAPGGQTKIYGVCIVEGEANYDTFGFASSSVSFAAGDLDNSACAVPRYDTMEEMYQAVEDGVLESASNAFYCREKRGAKKIYEVVDQDGANVLSTWGVIPDNFTTYGFDAFELQGKKYAVVNIGTSHTQNFQVYCLTDNQRVAISSLPEILGPSAQLSFNIEKVSDTKVNIYAVVYDVANVHCSCTPFEVDATVTQNEVYWDNTNTNWGKVYAYIWGDGGEYVEWPGTELTDPVDNIYTYVVPEGDYTKIIFTNGEGAQTANLDLEIGKTYEGEIPVEVEADMYVMGNIPAHSWDPSYKGAGMTTQSEGVYYIEKIELDNGEYAYFGFTTTPSTDWNVVNNNRYGATAGDKLITLNTPDQVVKSENSWKIASGVYNITLNINEMTILVTDQSGVEVVLESAAPAVYYNLQGVKVDNPANGLYIVKRGNNVTKELVK